MMVNLLFLVHCVTIMAVLAHFHQNVRKFWRFVPIFIFIQTALTHLNQNLKKCCSFLFILAASIFFASFCPTFLGKKFLEDLSWVGKSSDILNFIYQCTVLAQLQRVYCVQANRRGVCRVWSLGALG